MTNKSYLILSNLISNIEINIDNFSVFRNDRNRHGGGLALYMHNDYYFDSQTECIRVNIRYKQKICLMFSI